MAWQDGGEVRVIWGGGGGGSIGDDRVFCSRSDRRQAANVALLFYVLH